MNRGVHWTPWSSTNTTFMNIHLLTPVCSLFPVFIQYFTNMKEQQIDSVSPESNEIDFMKLVYLKIILQALTIIPNSFLLHFWCSNDCGTHMYLSGSRQLVRSSECALRFSASFADFQNDNLLSRVLTEGIEICLVVTDLNCSVFGSTVRLSVLPGTESLWKMCWNKLGTNFPRLKFFRDNLMQNQFLQVHHCPASFVSNHSGNHRRSEPKSTFVLATLYKIRELIDGRPANCSSSTSCLLSLKALSHLNTWAL